MYACMYVRMYICVRARACVCVYVPFTTIKEYVRLQTVSVQRIFRRRVVVSPDRILRIARSLNPPNPSVPLTLHG